MAQRMTGIEVGREGYRSAQEASADVPATDRMQARLPAQFWRRVDEVRDHPLCQWA